VTRRALDRQLGKTWRVGMRGEFVREDLPTTARCEPRSAACCRTRIARPGGAPWRLWALGHLAGVSVCRQGSNRSISSARGTGPGARVTSGARPGSAVTSIDACRYLTAVDVGSGTRVAPSVPHGRLRRRLGRRGSHDQLGSDVEAAARGPAQPASAATCSGLTLAARP